MKLNIHQGKMSLLITKVLFYASLTALSAAFAIGSFFAFTASASTTKDYFIIRGSSDVSSGLSVPFTFNDILKLLTSDDNRIQSNGAWPDNGAYDEAKYIEFVFSPNIPSDAIINSVV